MSKILCIPKPIAEKILAEFEKFEKKGEDIYNYLEKLNPQERVDFFSRFTNKKTAIGITALWEKAINSNNTNALAEWTLKVAYGHTKTPYKMKGIGYIIKQMQEMNKQNINVEDLKKLTSKERIKIFTKIFADTLPPDLAESAEMIKENSEKYGNLLNSYFERLQKTGNLKIWEEKALGTSELRKDEKALGAFNTLNKLSELGVLTPKTENEYLQSIVEEQLGYKFSEFQARKIDKMTKELSDLYDNVKGDWTFKNAEAVKAYFDKRYEMDRYISQFKPLKLFDLFTDTIAPGSLLMSLRSPVNSLVWQIWQGLGTMGMKKVLAGTEVKLPTDPETIKNIKLLTGLNEWDDLKDAWKQAQFAFGIYAKTGYDISRMITLDDESFLVYGEQFHKLHGFDKQDVGLDWLDKSYLDLKKYLNLENFKNLSKIKDIKLIKAYISAMSAGQKYMAGGTDVFGAALHKYGTVSMLASMRAKAEYQYQLEKNKDNPTELEKLKEKEKWIAERKKFYIKEGMGFSPETEFGNKLKNLGILDANKANNTEKNEFISICIRLRDKLVIPLGSLGRYEFLKPDEQKIKDKIDSLKEQYKKSTDETDKQKLSEEIASAEDELMKKGVILGDIKLGKLLLPFFKIPATVLGKGIKIASGGSALISIAKWIQVGLNKRDLTKLNKNIKGLTNRYDALKIQIENEKDLKKKQEKEDLLLQLNGEIQDKEFERENIYRNMQAALKPAISELVATFGVLTTTFILISAFGIDPDDDFISYYDFQKKSENNLSDARAKASANYIRIGGTWINLNWFPIINITLTGILEANKKKTSPLSAYMKGVAMQVLSFPGVPLFETALRRIHDWDSEKDFSENMDWAGNELATFFASRLLTNALYNDVIKPIGAEPKTDILGREKENNFIGKMFVGANINASTENEITKELLRLQNAGELPVLKNEIDGVEIPNHLKRAWANNLEKLFNSNYYQRLKDEDKKKKINELRKKYIDDKMKKLKK